jgi:hypothetical protein
LTAGEFATVTQSRALIVTSVLAGGLYIVGAIALGSPPTSTDSPDEVLAWFRDHGDAARLYAWTATFAALAFSVLAGIVRRLLPSPSRDIFMLGAAAFIIETAIQAWFWAALALHPDSLDPATARTLLDVATFWGPILTGATMTMMGAVTILGFGARPVIPKWLTRIGAIAFLEQAVETRTVFGTGGGFTSPGGDMNLLLGAGLTLIWLVALVVWAVGRVGSAEAPAAA